MDEPKFKVGERVIRSYAYVNELKDEDSWGVVKERQVVYTVDFDDFSDDYDEEDLTSVSDVANLCREGGAATEAVDVSSQVVPVAAEVEEAIEDIHQMMEIMDTCVPGAGVMLIEDALERALVERPDLVSGLPVARMLLGLKDPDEKETLPFGYSSPWS